MRASLVLCVAVVFLLAGPALAVNARSGSKSFKDPIRVLQQLYERYEAEAELPARVASSSSSSSGVACGSGYASGTCINTDNNNCDQGVLQDGLCPGGSNIVCCLTDWGGCSGGECITTDACAAEGGTSTPGQCPGPANVQCCSTGGPPAPQSWNTSMAYLVAVTWLKYGVQYSWSPNVDQFVTSGPGPYRSDCSGFVSAAWNEPPPGAVTQNFPCYPIDESDLQLGDALLNPSEHVAMFVGWDNNGNPIVVEECGHTPDCCGGDATCPGSCGSSSNDCDEYCPGCPIQLHSWPGIYPGFSPCRRNGW